MRKFFLMFYFLPILAISATLDEAIFRAKVQTDLKEGVVSACGVELMGVETAQTGTLNVFNGSIMFFDNLSCLVKARISTVDTKIFYSKDFNFNRDAKILETNEIWIKSKNQKPTKPIGKVAQSEDKGYILYITDNTLPILLSIMSDEEIQVGYQPLKIKHQKIMFGKARITDSELVQLAQCFKELRKSMEKIEN